jgi:hypothetical protein
MLQTASKQALVQKLHRREKGIISDGHDSIRKEGLRLPSLAFSKSDMNDIRVGKISFDMTNEDEHQECDPYALFLKAVAVESSIQGQQILPSCDTIHNCIECLDQGRKLPLWVLRS